VNNHRAQRRKIRTRQTQVGDAQGIDDPKQGASDGVRFWDVTRFPKNDRDGPLWKFASAFAFFSSSRPYIRTCILVSATAMLFACASSFAQRPIVISAFPPPEKMTPVDRGLRMGDFAALRSALDADTQLTQNEHGPVAYDPSQFETVDITPVQLGSLGRAFVVYLGRSWQCGATGNCPIALFLSGKHGYYDALDSGGWGFAIVPSGSAVPFAVSAWNMSCCEEDLSRFHFENGQFVADACEVETTTNDWADPKNIVVKSCKPNEPTFAPPLEWEGLGSAGPTYNEMKQLQPVAEADLENAFGSQADLHFADLPVINLGDWLVLGVPHRYSSNMSLFVYPVVQGKVGSAVLSNVPGNAAEEIAASSDMTVAEGLVIRRSAGPVRAELVEYLEPREQNGVKSPTSLVSESCEFAAPKDGIWAPVWNAKEIRVHAVPCSGLTSASSAVLDGTLLDKVEQDSSGAVWAITPAFEARLVRWQDGQWSPVMGPVPNEFAALGPGPSGGVWVSFGKPIWLDGDEKKTLQGPAWSSHGIATTLRLAGGGALAVSVPQPPGGPSLSILRADGNSVDKYDVTPEQLRPAYGKFPCWAPFLSTFGAGKMTWIWTSRKPDCPGLRGFVLTDGRSFIYEPEIRGLPDKPISALGAWPGDVLAAAVPNDGVYLIDPATLSARRLPPPSPSAFQRVAAFFRAGEDGYVIAEGGCSTGAFGLKHCDPVWRLRDGQWQLVISALDRFIPRRFIPQWIQFPDDFIRPSPGLVTPQGLWLGGVGSGLWLIPSSGAAKEFTARDGFPLYKVGLLFQLPNGLILAVHAPGELDSRSVAVDPARLTATARALPQ
jgi:hypothetical protein